MTGLESKADQVVREAVDAWLQRRKLEPAMLLAERSDRGDALRALRSLLDALEHERIEFDRVELRARVADLLATIGA